MTLYIHRGNRLEALVDQLAALPPLDPPDPFEPETLVLQTRGMERWLGMRLAETRGIFAHARFVAFDDLLNELMDALLPDPRALQWRPGNLVWRIAETLRLAFGASHGKASDARTDLDLTALASWLARVRPPSVADLPPALAPRLLTEQVMRLAWHIADVFHRYALYRPAMVEAWSLGQAHVGPAGSPPADRWQPVLWRRLATLIGADSPGRRIQRLVEALDAGAPLPPRFPRRVVLFGHHTMAPVQIDALAALGRRTEVHLFRPAVGADQSRYAHHVPHPLRASLGRLLDDFDHLLSERAPGATRLDHLLEPSEDTLLGKMQSAIFHGVARETFADTTIAASDTSLTFHACASPLRQVEVLRDELLGLFATHPDLEPRDVIVMTPDIETYAPLIDAVFRDGDRELPPEHPGSAGFPPIHRLHDLSLRRTNPIAESFLAILDLAPRRLSLPEVLDLVSLPPIIAAMGLLEDELRELIPLIEESGIRWGADEGHRARVGQPASRPNTWAGGFERLLLGHALATTGVDDFFGVVPVDDVEGKETTRSLGLFVDYVERLFAALDSLAQPRSMETWRDTLTRLVERLLVHDDASAGLAQSVFDVLTQLAERAEQGGFDGVLDLGAVRSLLVDPFESRRASVSFLSGGLTFCTLVPMRTIPFRVVCLLGMDDGVFPRASHGVGFDLIEAARERGDRSAREDDRMTFLETVLAARHHLLVTWTGYRATDRRELDAAGPVAELMESLRRALMVDRLPAQIHIEHPLQPFSPSNFREPPRSFDRRYLLGATRLLGQRHAPPEHWSGTAEPTLPREIALDDLARCLEGPAQWFCERRMNVRLKESDTTLAEREPIDLDGLQLWTLRDRVLAWELDDVDPDHRVRALESTGALPPGASGRLTLGRIEDEVRTIAERVRRLRAAAPGCEPETGQPTGDQQVPVDLVIEGIRFTGQVDAVWGSRRIQYQAGKLKMKSALGLWVRHLALAATRRCPVESFLVSQDVVVFFRPLAPPLACHYLSELAALYLVAHTRPLLFFPETSWLWYASSLGTSSGPQRSSEPRGTDGRDSAAITKDVRDAWLRTSYFTGKAEEIGEGADPHVTLLLGHRDLAAQSDDFPFDQTDFQRLAAAIYAPLRARADGSAATSESQWIFQRAPHT